MSMLNTARMSTLLFLAFMCLLGCAQAEQTSRKDIVFNNHEQRLDLYLPKVRDKETAIMFIHGGGFSAGDKAEMEEHARLYAKKGFVTTSINYRLSLDASYPAAINDAKDAIKWMKTNANQYGYNPEKIVLVGYSAGGTLALNAGLDHTQGIAAIIDVAGISDIKALLLDPPFPELEAAVKQYMGEKDPAVASPLNQVNEKSPPVLILHGNADHVVPISQSIALEEKLKKHQVPVKFDVFGRADHSIFLTSDRYFSFVITKITDYIMQVEENNAVVAASEKN